MTLTKEDVQALLRVALKENNAALRDHVTKTIKENNAAFREDVTKTIKENNAAFRRDVTKTIKENNAALKETIKEEVAETLKQALTPIETRLSALEKESENRQAALYRKGLVSYQARHREVREYQRFLHLGQAIFTCSAVYYVVLLSVCFTHHTLWNVTVTLPLGGAVFLTTWANVLAKKKKRAEECDTELRDVIREVANDLDKSPEDILEEVETRFITEPVWWYPDACLDAGDPLPGNIKGDVEVPEPKHLKQLLATSGLIRRSHPRRRSPGP